MSWESGDLLSLISHGEQAVSSTALGFAEHTLPVDCRQFAFLLGNVTAVQLRRSQLRSLFSERGSARLTLPWFPRCGEEAALQGQEVSAKALLGQQNLSLYRRLGSAVPAAETSSPLREPPLEAESGAQGPCPGQSWCKPGQGQTEGSPWAP